MAADNAESTGKRLCECPIDSCNDDSCDKPDCKVCKVCCEESCPGCKKCTKKDKCLCRLKRCGCKTNCYGEEGKDVQCQGKSTCPRCNKRCSEERLGNRCICANCDCGCSYGLCNCCPWCKRNYCTGNCNGYVIGRCEVNSKDECKGHYKFCGVENEDVPKKSGEDVLCAYAQDYQNGLCLYKCTACGRLCVKHFCHCVGSVIITIGVIVFIMFIAWNKYPEKFRRVYYDLRGAFNMAPGHPGRSLSDLVGGRIPDVNVDRYPAFRPRTFAGLS